MLVWLCFTPLLALLVLAALTDLRERRIPNWLTGGIAALYPLYVLASPAPVAWLAALALGGVLFSLGIALFAKELIGGGDVKLIAAVSLWAGFELVALFALVTTLTGGVLALVTLAVHRWGPLVQAQLAAAGLSFATATGPSRAPDRAPDGAVVADSETGPARERPRVTLPYGVAIAAGGIAVVVELMKL